jgi:hypothetical protein
VLLSPRVVWWERFDRAAAAKRRDGPAGSKLMSDTAREVLGVICDAEEGLDRGWQPVPPERRTEEYVQREKLRLYSGGASRRRADAMTGLAESAWWARVERASNRRGRIGSKLMSDWSVDVVEVHALAAECFELVDGGWQPVPAERCTEEYKQREICRLTDELGVRLGVGPMP